MWWKINQKLTLTHSHEKMRKIVQKKKTVNIAFFGEFLGCRKMMIIKKNKFIKECNVTQNKTKQKSINKYSKRREKCWQRESLNISQQS